MPCAQSKKFSKKNYKVNTPSRLWYETSSEIQGNIDNWKIGGDKKKHPYILLVIKAVGAGGEGSKYSEKYLQKHLMKNKCFLHHFFLKPQ